MATYYRVLDNTLPQLKDYIGHTGIHDKKSDVRKPLMMLDFGRGRKMAFAPEEVEEVGRGSFDPQQKFRFECKSDGCYKKATGKGCCPSCGHRNKTEQAKKQ